MGQIKAIPTEYNGYLFRSRLEARWAVFFDALDIRYEYELDGYRMSDGTKYLPDFYLPDVNEGIFIEVKGPMSAKDYHKTEMFWHESGTPLYVVGGLPTQSDLCGNSWAYVDKYEHCFEYGCGAGEDQRRAIHTPGWDWPYLFCVCPACGRVGVEFDGRGWRVCGERHKDKSLKTSTYRDEDGTLHRFMYPEIAGWRTDDKGYSWNHRKLVKAYDIARRARFEHGETPTKESVQDRMQR